MNASQLDTIKNILGRGKILDCLQAFDLYLKNDLHLKQTPEWHKSQLRKLFLLKAKYYRIEDHNDRGIIKYEEYDQQLNKMTNSILSLIESVENIY